MMCVCLSVVYIGPKSRTERPRKTKIGTEVAHVTRDSDTTFKVRRSKVNLHGARAYCGGLPYSLLSVAAQCCGGGWYIWVVSCDGLCCQHQLTHTHTHTR